jgi:hypothetical protein
MCICLNCFYFKVCKIYYWIEKQHKENSYYNYKIQFFPYSPIILVSELKDYYIEYDLINCLSYTFNPGDWIFDLELVFFFEVHEYI